MTKGQKFHATDKLGRTFLYEYIGIETTSNGYDIRLFNHNFQDDTYVEQEWFNQRQIVMN